MSLYIKKRLPLLTSKVVDKYGVSADYLLNDLKRQMKKSLDFDTNSLNTAYRQIKEYYQVILNTLDINFLKLKLDLLEQISLAGFKKD